MGGIIAGGVVGGLVIVAIIVAIILYCRMKSQSEEKKKQMDFMNNIGKKDETINIEDLEKDSTHNIKQQPIRGKEPTYNYGGLVFNT